MKSTELTNMLRVILQDLQETNKTLFEQSRMIKMISERTETLGDMNCEMEASLALYEAFILEKGLHEEFECFAEKAVNEFIEGNRHQRPGIRLV